MKWTTANSTKAQAIRELKNRGWWNIVPHGKFSVEATGPDGHRGLYDPRDLLTELDHERDRAFVRGDETPNLDRGKTALAALLAAGTVWTEPVCGGTGTEYYGRASDGVVVTLATVFHKTDMNPLYSYLADYPTPDVW
jgi:hypothetical protein